MWNAGVMDSTVTYVHCSTLSEDSYQRIAATVGAVSVATESEMNAGQGLPAHVTAAALRHPVSLSQDTSVWWSGDMFSAMRATLNADRARCHLDATPAARRSRSTNCGPRTWVRTPRSAGARAIGREHDLGSIRVGKKADLVLF